MTGLVGPALAPSTRAVASEALTAGDWVNLWNDAGNLRARRADASSPGWPAHGFVGSAVASGAAGTVFYDGVNRHRTGLTIGAAVYLSTTAGQDTATAPSTTGEIVQRLGVAVSATSVLFAPTPPVTLG